MKTLVICSGGLDSVSLAHIVAAERQLTRLVSFDYGQRHRKELDFAAAAAQRLNVPHHLIDMRPIGAALTGSALTDDIDVPDGHYAEETMRITVVPNRNAIMLAIGFGVAAANGDEAVATAVHGGDLHCGRCGTCVERREAFHLAGVADPTAYADPDYWLSAIAGKEGH
jgi:7-cyano-7-deazaguanine synthase